MTSTVSPRRKRGASVVGAVAVATVLLAGLARAQDPAAAPAAPAALEEVPGFALERGPGAFADRFPNVVLKTHEGRNVRFYDDLLEGKIVLINFMYATCTER